MMPRYYIKNLGGASKVNMLVGLAPSSHGTTVDGLNALLNDLTIMGVPFTSVIGCVSCTEQVLPSSFISSLNGAATPSPGRSTWSSRAGTTRWSRPTRRPS